MDWKPYGSCCHRCAVHSDAAFCPECGHAFIRCMAFAECGSLISPTQACPVCVAPSLLLDAGAVKQSKAGERVSVPLILRNDSPAARTLWVKRIVKYDGLAEEPVPLTWEQLEPRAERRFELDTPPLTEGGTHTVRFILVLASRHKGVEEDYAFGASVTLTVSGQHVQQIVQNIDLSGATFGTGGMVYTPLNTPAAQQTGNPISNDRERIALDRAEKYELEQGIRGYARDALRVPRHVTFHFASFPAADHPMNGSTLTAGGRLVCGRNSRRPRDAGTLPSDLCLRAYHPQTGALDEAGTLAISRHHFDVLVVNDRLCLHVRTTHGVDLNGKTLAAGALVPLASGDRLAPIPGRADIVALQVRFVASFGSVERVELHRTPAIAA